MDPSIIMFNLIFSLVGLAGCGLYYGLYVLIKRRKRGAAE